MMVFDGRLGIEVRPALALQIERRAALHDAPAVIVALLDEESLLVEVLPVLSAPDVAGLGVGGDSPRIAQAERPDFRAGVFQRGERVVPGNAVMQASRGA